MTKAWILGGAIVTLLVAFGLAGRRALDQGGERQDADPRGTAPIAVISPAGPPRAAASTEAAGEAAHPSFLYGRVSTDGGRTYEGRLRWGGDEEAFWGDYFNGVKIENRWAALVPPERLPRVDDSIAFMGLEIVHRERPADLDRFFMARFGDVARIEPSGRAVRVTLKSGTVFDLDRFEATDFDDGVRVWDARGVVDLDSLEIRSIELLPAARPGAAPDRLHGTVRSRQGEFTGFVQWNRQLCVGSDELEGRSAEGELGLRFDAIRSIARRSSRGSSVTLRDGREIVLFGAHEVGDGNARGIYVDDPRYGRVLISWGAFERLDFSARESGAPAELGDPGPAYDDFPPGRPLTGSVTTRAGSRLGGRLVFDLDESETTETLDAPSRGVDYTIPFGLVASIVAPDREAVGDRHELEQAGISLTLHGGETLELERAGDFGERNAGMLIFVDGGERPEYVPWAEVARIDFDRPPAMYPPLGLGRPRVP